VKGKFKELEFRLREMLELNKQSQTTKEKSKSKSNIGNVIRRRKAIHGDDENDFFLF